MEYVTGSIPAEGTGGVHAVFTGSIVLGDDVSFGILLLFGTKQAMSALCVAAACVADSEFGPHIFGQIRGIFVVCGTASDLGSVYRQRI